MSAGSLPVNLAGFPLCHLIRVDQGNYVNGRGRLMTVAELLRAESSDEERRGEYGGYEVIDCSPAECRCQKCRRERKAVRRAMRADRRHARRRSDL
jgi:hypothetical protein